MLIVRGAGIVNRRDSLGWLQDPASGSKRKLRP
jgi:hypothetical protein